MNLIDENDNVPMFTKRIYYIDIPEDHPVDSDMSKPIGKVSAVDADAGDNAAIKYSIIGGNKASVFSINSETGDIYLLQSLDREVQVSLKTHFNHQLYHKKVFFFFLCSQLCQPVQEVRSCISMASILFSSVFLLFKTLSWPQVLEIKSFSHSRTPTS